MNTNAITDVAWAEMQDTKYKNNHPGPVGGLGIGILALLCFPHLFSCFFIMVGLKIPSLKLFGDGQILHSMGALILLCARLWEQNGTATRQQSHPIREREITNTVTVELEILLKEYEKVPPPN